MLLGPQGPGKVGQRGGFSFAGVAQLVEHYLAKVDVASSNLVSRSIPPHRPPVGALLFDLGRCEGNPSLLTSQLCNGGCAVDEVNRAEYCDV